MISKSEILTLKLQNHVSLIELYHTTVCWRHVTPGCVNSHNIKRYRGKSVHQCKELCAKNSDCKAFEYGVSHGGSKKHYRTGDCQLNSGSNSAGCDGVANNLDLYIQISCTPVGKLIIGFIYLIHYMPSSHYHQVII